MKRTWPIIAVADVVKSTEWYVRLLDAQNTHTGGTVFDQVIAKDGSILLCLHHWGPSGPRGDHLWPSLADPNTNAGNGFLCWFVVHDFDAAWERAQALGARIEEPPNTNNGTGMPAFKVRDPDGYYVVVNKARTV